MHIYEGNISKLCNLLENHPIWANRNNYDKICIHMYSLNTLELSPFLCCLHSYREISDSVTNPIIVQSTAQQTPSTLTIFIHQSTTATAAAAKPAKTFPAVVRPFLRSACRLGNKTKCENISPLLCMLQTIKKRQTNKTQQEKQQKHVQ